MKYDIITFGSATLDVFLETKEFLIKPEKKFSSGQSVCFPFASKADVQELCFSTGGGGTNCAATLSLQGFNTAYCGTVGMDFAGREALKELKKFGIDTRFVFETQKAATNFSVIFSWGKDRTCFVWRGASEFLAEEKMPWNDFKASWFYLAPLSGATVKLFEPLVNFAKKQGIKVFANPGNGQIRLGARVLKPILKKIDIILLNQEEASLLTGLPFQKKKETFRSLNKMAGGIVAITQGSDGAIVSDGEYIWQANALPVKVVEKTGAGDAFGSGFLAGFIQKQDISYALQFGIANSAACIQKIGTKQGLLKKSQLWRKVKVIKRKL